MVIYYKMTIKISLNTNIIHTLQSNVTNNNNVCDLFNVNNDTQISKLLDNMYTNVITIKYG
jgi:hypothetical protein